jgi:hypothetical protein
MESNLCPYRQVNPITDIQCKMPYEEHRCLNHYKHCALYQRKEVFKRGMKNLEKELGIGAMDKETIKTISAEKQTRRLREMK